MRTWHALHSNVLLDAADQFPPPPCSVGKSNLMKCICPVQFVLRMQALMQHFDLARTPHSLTSCCVSLVGTTPRDTIAVRSTASCFGDLVVSTPPSVQQVSTQYQTWPCGLLQSCMSGVFAYIRPKQKAINPKGREMKQAPRRLHQH